MNEPSKNIRQLYHDHTITCYPRASGIVMERGEGTYVWDLDGKQYLDFSCGIAVNNLGHCHPKIVETIKQQASMLLHTSNQFYNIPHAKLAQKLTHASGLSHAFFCNTGAEANEGSLKLARKWGATQGKSEIICFNEAFHGRTLGAISATRKEKLRSGYGPFLDEFVAVPAFDLCAIEKAISPKTAAIIMEPIIGGIGVVESPQGVAESLRELADKHNFLIIFDEMQSAFGRTGKTFAYQHYKMKPDILSLAKALGSGVPIGAIVCREGLQDVYGLGGHGTTFGGNPLSSAVGCTTLDIITEASFLKSVAERGEYLQRRLKELSKKHSKILDSVRGRGLMVGVSLHVSSSDLLVAMSKNGLLCVGGGKDSIRVYPPLTISNDEIDEGCDILEKTVSNFTIK